MSNLPSCMYVYPKHSLPAEPTKGNRTHRARVPDNSAASGFPTESSPSLDLSSPSLQLV